MVFNKEIQLFLIILLLTVGLSQGCGNQPSNPSEDKKAKVITPNISMEERLLTPVSATETTEPEISHGKPINSSLLKTEKNEFQSENTFMDINWGQEVNLDTMIAMSRKGEIAEINWYVMPNILSARAMNGEILHLKNENKGVDLRNTLIKAGVKIGEGGVLFKHFF